MKFFYSLIAFFVFIVFSSLFIAKTRYSLNKLDSSVHESSKVQELVNTPILTGHLVLPTTSAFSALAVDLDSGKDLYQKNPDLSLLPASTTKIVTALVSIDHFPLNKVLKVANLDVQGQKMHLEVDEEITVRDLLYGLLIFSANDAAEVLAQNYDGGREAFIGEMNTKAKKLGLINTFFNNPSGLDGEEHYTTARDLAKVSTFAMKNPFFRKAVATKEISVTSIDAKFKHKLININELLGEVDGVLGIKTGWTENARENLVTYLERQDKRILIVILGSQDRFGETRQLIDWIFANYTWQNMPKEIVSY